MFHHRSFSAQSFNDQSWKFDGATVREVEIDFESIRRKAKRLRSQAKVTFSTPKQSRKSHQIEIRAAKQAASDAPPQEIASSVLALYIEWLTYQPTITLIGRAEEGTENNYAAFLAVIGRLIHRWELDEEEAILALLL